MSRRIPTLRAQLWIVLVLLLAAGALVVPAAPVWAEEESSFAEARPIIDDPEVGIPGDDDQPTIKGRKRGIVIVASQPAPSGSDSGVRSRLELRERWTRGIEALRAFVRRSWVMLR